jgi:hypothetical protein
MTGFEFVFPMFGLLVGLSFAEMLAGLARALKNKREVRVGWLTPLLGLVILLNLTVIWLGAWDMRDVAEPSSAGMLFILVVGGSYFLASSLVFPSSDADVRDLDEHFMANRRLALLVIAGCNFLYLVRMSLKLGAGATPLWWIGNAGFLALLVLAALSRDRRIILGVLMFLVAAHGVMLAMGGTASSLVSR